VFITNMIPLHALVLILMGRFSNRLYVAYSTWYAVGTLASMQVPFVGFQPVSTSEHMGALGNAVILHPFAFINCPFNLGVFGLMQLVAFTELVRSHVAEKHFQTLFRYAFAAIGLLGFAAFIVLSITGKIAPWTGRFYSLWDTEYAKK
jgi:dolichyl-diphosphooligosaccharide--protein glycosyltransferase